MNSFAKWEVCSPESPPPFSPDEIKSMAESQQEYATQDSALTEGVENAQRKLWLQFQSTASQMTKMYRDGQSNPELLWHCFQLSAGSLTQLYKDAMEEIGVVRDRAYKTGYSRAKQDVGTWAKTAKRRFVRRDELLSVIALALPGGGATRESDRPGGEALASGCPLEDESLADRGAGELEQTPSHPTPVFAHLPHNRLKRHRSSGGGYANASAGGEDFMDLFTIKRPRRN